MEVKNVTLGREGRALFPDAVTARGTKHLNELMKVVAGGERAAMLFVVQREDGRAMAPADDIDPLYGRTLRDAAAAGVELLAYRARVSPRELRLDRPLPVELPGAAKVGSAPLTGTRARCLRRALPLQSPAP